MFLIFDTETTGLPRNYNAPLTDFDNWPRMVQLAWQLHDEKGNILQHQSIIIRPEGFTIPFATIQIHGITNERALEEGADLRESLNSFRSAVSAATYLCGHNIEFDINIIGAEFLRSGLDNPLEEKPFIDTKNDQTTEFCAIPGGRGGKFKWPTLTELYSRLFNSTFEEAHNAAFDVEATAKVFFEVLKRGITKVAELASDQLVNIEYIAPDFTELKKHELYWKERKQREEKEREAIRQKEEAAKNALISEAARSSSSIRYSHAQSYAVLCASVHQRCLFHCCKSH